MIFFMVFKELFHRWINTVLAVLGIVMAVAFFIAFFTLNNASKRETIRLTRDMGFNLRIIPKSTDMDAFWTSGFSEQTMPEEFVARFMSYKDFSYAHLTATLHKKIEWNGRNIILTGISSELEPSGRNKSPMSPVIKKNSAIVGWDLAHTFQLKKGDSLNIGNRKFFISQTLSETGSSDDIRIYLQLKDVQEIAQLPGQINEIMALNCLCMVDEDDDPLVVLRRQLDKVLPDAKVIMNKTIAHAREKQRLMMERYAAFAMPFVMVVCAVWIGVLFMLNVRERKTEIGVLHAVGFSGFKVFLLFAVRAVLIGIIGAILGFLAGNVLAMEYGPDIFRVTAKAIHIDYQFLFISLIAAPLFAVVAGFIPAMVALSQDPADILREE